jgi:predicted TIM-barrel fold metal-dependent hydrolase
LGAFAQDVVDSESSNPYSSSALLASIVKHYNSRKVFSAHLGGIYRAEIERSKISFQTTGACVSAIEYACRVVGPDRIVFGSDNPFFDPAEEINKIRMANIPEKSKEKILGKNMEEILGLH